MENYNTKLKVAYKTTVKQGLTTGIGFGAVGCIIFCTYGLAMWYGAKLVRENGYSGGTVITIIMALVTGGM